MTTAFNAFLEAIAKATPIEFNPEWRNDTGYFNKAVTDKSIKQCELLTTTCTFSKRRILIVGTEVGNVVLFERYTPKDDSVKVIVSNVPHVLLPLVPSGSLSFDDVMRVVGVTTNIGEFVADIRKGKSE